MSAINWTEIAMQCSPSIGSQLRGVLKITRFGFHVLFVPNVERLRVERELAEVDLVFHGYAVWTREDGKEFFLVVVKTDSTPPTPRHAPITTRSSWSRPGYAPRFADSRRTLHAVPLLRDSQRRKGTFDETNWSDPRRSSKRLAIQLP